MARSYRIRGHRCSTCGQALPWRVDPSGLRNTPLSDPAGAEGGGGGASLACSLLVHWFPYLQSVVHNHKGLGESSVVTHTHYDNQ